MSYINTEHQVGHGKKSRKRHSHLSTVVDMTPMVDLGFLLITFFIFTATMNNPTLLPLFVPKDSIDRPTEVKECCVLTIMIGKDNQVYYYEGKLMPGNEGNDFKQSDFVDIRKVILDKKRAVMDLHQHDNRCEKIQLSAKLKGDPDWQNACLDRDFVVILMPDKDASYKNAVDMLDEMTIDQVKTYPLVRIPDREYELIRRME